MPGTRRCSLPSTNNCRWAKNHCSLLLARRLDTQTKFRYKSRLMRNGWRHAILVISPAAVMTVASQGAAAQVKRTADGKPDFSGIWQTNSTANWDLQTHEARPMVAQPGVYADAP